MKILIFDTEIEGHHLECINHIYNKAANYSKNEYVFVVPNEFKTKSQKLNWQPAKNIEFDFLTDKEILLCNGQSQIINSFYKTTILKKKIKEHHVDHIFLIVLIHFLPFLPLFLKKIKISGIIYQIYLYKWQEYSYLRKPIEIFKYLLLSRFNIFSRVYILNDRSAAIHLNKKYKTSKFHYLPDPIVLPFFKLSDIRNKLSISSQKTVFLHFGSLDIRKGTLEILKAIKLIPEIEKDKYCFIFAGKINKEIKNSFYELSEELSKSIQILVFDYFCEFQFIGNLCFSSDYILTPYTNTSQSSGVLGYAAVYQTPLIGPQKGLLGKLIKKNKLGITTKDNSAASIYHTIISANKQTLSLNNKYINEHSIEIFGAIIFEEYMRF